DLRANGFDATAGEAFEDYTLVAVRNGQTRITVIVSRAFRHPAVRCLFDALKARSKFKRVHGQKSGRQRQQRINSEAFPRMGTVTKEKPRILRSSSSLRSDAGNATDVRKPHC